MGTRLKLVLCFSSFSCPPKWTKHIHNSTVGSHKHFIIPNGSFHWSRDYSMTWAWKLARSWFDTCVLIWFNVHQNLPNTYSKVSLLYKYHFYFCVVYLVIYIIGHVIRAFKMALLHDRQLQDCTTSHYNPFKFNLFFLMFISLGMWSGPPDVL